jgi:hypothetical protein
MQQYKLFIFVLAQFFFALAHAQTPHISGKVNINVKRGIIECDLYLRNLPTFDDPVFVLNKGMNLQFLQANGKTIDYNTDFGVLMKSPFLDEGLAYSPTIDSINDKTVFHIRYVGAFPTYNLQDSTHNYKDSQVNIAIENEVLRASYMTKWYPFFYDRTENKLISKFTYNLDIQTNISSKSIYINGCKPQHKRNFHAVSNVPNDLCLYVGKYDFEKVQNLSFLNVHLPQSAKEGIAKTVTKINAFYNEMLGQNNQTDFVLAQIFSVGRKNQYEAWALAEYPCVLMDFNQISTKLDFETREITDIQTFKILAHEIAHQYWGLKVKANNAYWGFYSESFAEYFALKAVAKFFDANEYAAFLQKNYLAPRYFATKCTPLDKLTNQTNPNRWYYYYPVILLGLDYNFLKTKNNALYQFILNDKNNQNLDYTYFKECVLKMGMTKEEWQMFENQFINTENCLQNKLEIPGRYPKRLEKTKC